MRFITVLFIVSLFVSVSCSERNSVYIRGRIESADSVVQIWMSDSVYTFALDENRFFSGRIHLEKGEYASLLPCSRDIYLSPGEDLEVYVSSSVSFKGSLGAINNYMQEQELILFFDNSYYLLDEQAFVTKMSEILEEQMHMLEAKNFSKSFTELEKWRVHYLLGERSAVYPLYHKQYTNDSLVRSGRVFEEFLQLFPLTNDELFVTKSYRKFLLNYVYFRTAGLYEAPDYANKLTDFILQNFSNVAVRNFLLSEVLFRYMWENNGLNNAANLLKAFRENCGDIQQYVYVEEVISHWEHLLPGNPAMNFVAETPNGDTLSLEDFRGRYVYISVWASWSELCQKELAFLKELERRYDPDKVVFLALSVDRASDKPVWRNVLKQNTYGGIHAIVPENQTFKDDYMLLSIPRFILIDPEGKIVNSDAPQPRELEIEMEL